MTDVAAQLVAHATDRGLTLDVDTATFLIRARGEQPARDLVDGAGALIDLSSALGHDLDQAAAFRRLDAAAGDYQTAALRIIEPFRRHRQHTFACAWSENERKLYAGDAKARHAVFVGHLAGGSLGWQASMLLQAAGDASLQQPGVDGYRVELLRAVGAEIDRRYPVRREALWQVIGEDTLAHAQIVRAEIRREQQARDLVLGRRPELAQRIDALRSSFLVRDVDRVLRRIRKRLAQRADEGWIADPERYAREVIATALEAACEAS